MSRSLVLVCLLILLCLTLIGNVPPFEIPTIQASPDSELHFWANKVSIPLPSGVSDLADYDIQETSYGLFLATDDGKIYRTTDNGQSWDLVFTYPISSSCYILFKTAEEWLIARWSNVYSGTNTAVSKDGNGASWQYADSYLGGFHHCMTQHPNGTFYNALAGDYIMRSDNALNWTTWANASQVIVDLGGDPGSPFHAHALVYDIDGNYLYLAVGDSVSGTSWAGSGKAIIYHNGTGWNGLYPNQGAGVGAVATEEGVIFGVDFANEDLHITLNESSTDLYLVRTKAPNLHKYLGQLDIVNDVVYVGIRTQADNKPYGLYASPDHGRNWITIVEETGDNTNWIDYLVSDGQGSSLIVCRLLNLATAQLWRMYAPSQKEMLHEVNQGYVSVSSGTYSFIKDVGNDTDYVDLATVSVTAAKIKLTGVSHKNFWNNTSFEDGETGYSFSGSGTHSTTTSQKKYGSYSLSVNKTGSEGSFEVSQGYFDVVDDNQYLVSFWIRTNVSAGNYYVYLQYLQKNTTGQRTGWQNVALATPTADTWAQRKALITTNALNNVSELFVRIQLRRVSGTNMAWWLDGIVIEHVNRARPDKQHSPANPSDFFEGTQNTTDVSLTIAGETITHNGELADGEETSETSLPNLAKTGMETISNIQVSGSGIVKVTITATIEFQVTAIFLREIVGGVYVGRRYNDTITIPTTISSLICISDGESNITEASPSGDLLSLTISAWSGQTTSTKVYCGDKGEPRTVSEADSWSYDSSTKICTITVTHSSTKTVTLEWGKPITATLDIEPDTLNLKSKRKWINAYIELPEDHNVSNIDVYSILLNDSIPLGSDAPSEIGDYDEDGIQDLIVKFDRASMTKLLSVGEATLIITGQVNDMPFEGTDTIRVTGK